MDSGKNGGVTLFTSRATSLRQNLLGLLPQGQDTEAVVQRGTRLDFVFVAKLADV